MNLTKRLHSHSLCRFRVITDTETIVSAFTKIVLELVLDLDSSLPIIQSVPEFFILQNTIKTLKTVYNFGVGNYDNDL